MITLFENWDSKLKTYNSKSNIRVDAWLQINEDDMDKTQVIIDFIEVPIEERFNGKGRKEVNKIINWAKEEGANEINIESKREAIPFWKRLGFEILDQGSEISSGWLKL